MANVASEWLNEWKKHDPFLEDLGGYQVFCDIKAAGGKYPLNPEEDIFFTVDLARQEWEPNGVMGVCGHDCIPQESADDHWERNNKASKIIREVIATKMNADTEEWRDHLNDSKLHLEWISEKFEIKLTEKDFEEAWLLFEHKEWFEGNGYHIRGWLAVAEALGVGTMARKMLENTPFPHADNPKIDPERLCKHMDVCPIYQFRLWLETIQVKIPELVFRFTNFQSNVSYYLHDITENMFVNGQKKKVEQRINRPTVDFRVKWKILKMIRDFMERPRCKKCGEIAYDRDGEWEGQELCWKHILIMQKAYMTKINPLTGPGALTIPHGVVAELRKKLIEGDPMFDGIKVAEGDG